MAKVLSRSKYLQALALFTIAEGHARKSSAFADELCELLGYSDHYAGHISDEITRGGNFDSAMKKEGFTLAKGVSR